MTLASAATTDRRGLLARLEVAWQRSDFLFSLLADEALYVRPIALRQPFIFYVGHLPAFGWNQVCRGLLGRTSPQPQFDDVFARGIDPVGVDRYDGAEQWPHLSEVLAYRDRVRDALRAAFDDVAALEGKDVLADRGRIWQIVIEHELMHHETLLYMMQQLPRHLKKKPIGIPDYRFNGAAHDGTVAVTGGEVNLGADFERVPFGWDNEFPAHQARVGDFAIDRTPVRTIEWLEFVMAGVYQKPELWNAEAWAWRQRVGHDKPAFWRREGSRWLYQTLFDELPVEQVADWPAYVSWAEADAWARWRGRDLPTEAELHRAMYGTPHGEPRRYPWGEAALEARHGNFDFTNWAPTPVGAYPEGVSAWGVHDAIGNGWQWTKSRFAGFPGFTAWARTYPGYSADFFDERHYVILGGSWATDRALVRRSFRNWFQPHYPYVFATFRTVDREDGRGERG